MKLQRLKRLKYGVLHRYIAKRNYIGGLLATKQSTVDYILDQLVSAGSISARKMFGEYALYCDGKVVGLVCDDTLYVKITDHGKIFAGEYYQEENAYTCFLIDSVTSSPANLNFSVCAGGSAGFCRIAVDSVSCLM
jgi:hypothetical protein